MALTKDQLEEIRKEHAPGVPLELVMAVYQQESSSGANTATSHKGAVGGFQVTPTAAKEVGIPPSLLVDEKTNAIAGMKYLERQFVATKDPFQAAARYFGGPDAMKNLSITDGNVSRGTYATQVAERFRRLSGTGDQTTSTSPAGGGMGATNITAMSQEMLEAFGVSSAANRSASEAIQTAITTATEQTQVQVDAITDIGSLAADVILDTRKQQELKRAQFSRNAATAGIGKDDVNSLFASMVTEYNDHVDKTIRYRNAINERNRLGFFEDPLGFLQAHLIEIPQLTDEHNAEARDAKLKADRIATLNSLVQTQNVTDNVQFAELSQEGAAAEARVAALKATADAAKIIQAGAIQVAQLSVNQATIENKTLNELQQMEQVAVLRQQREYQQLLLSERYADLKRKNELNARFDKDLAAVGHTRQTFEGLNNDAQNAVAKMIATGKIGDRYEAVINVSLIPNIKLTPGQGLIVREIKQLYDESGVDANLALPKKEDKLNAGNNHIKQAFERYAADANAFGERNPYHAPSPRVMSEAIKDIPTITPLFKNLITTLGQAQAGTITDDKMVLQAVTRMIGKNGYSREMAIKDTSSYYTMATALNTKTKRFQDFNVPEQTAYNVNFSIPARISAAGDDVDKPGTFVSTANLFSTTVKANLANEAAVSSVITLLQARLKRMEEVGPSAVNQTLLAPIQ